MTLLSMASAMLLVIFIGRETKAHAAKQFMIIVLITIIEVFVTALEMFTKQVPPMN